LRLAAGDASLGTGVRGGDLTLQAGEGDQDGGNVLLSGGQSNSGTQGSVTLRGGSSTVGTTGGSVVIAAGDSAGGLPTGGSVIVSAGGPSGTVALNSGDNGLGSSQLVVGPDVAITAQDTLDAFATGSISLTAATIDLTSLAGGDILIESQSMVGSTGSVTLSAGSTGSATLTDTAGSIELIAGSATAGGTGGDVVLQPGSSTDANRLGQIKFGGASKGIHGMYIGVTSLNTVLGVSAATSITLDSTFSNTYDVQNFMGIPSIDLCRQNSVLTMSVQWGTGVAVVVTGHFTADGNCDAVFVASSFDGSPVSLNVPLSVIMYSSSG
jgi:hypothetical protein